MLYHPVVSAFVENLFNQPVLLPVVGVGMIVFVKWLWWLLGGSGVNQGSRR